MQQKRLAGVGFLSVLQQIEASNSVMRWPAGEAYEMSLAVTMTNPP